jgi:hypothetical protein
MSEIMITIVNFDREFRANRERGQRYGQAAFNALPSGMSCVLLDTPADPYEIDDQTELLVWILDHLVYSDDGLRIIGVRNLHRKFPS